MKKLLIFAAMMVSLAFAESKPFTHDGFFLNISLGFGHQSIDFAYDSHLYNEDGQHIYEFNQSGLATDLDLKFGGRIANNLLLHVTLAGSTSIGEVDVGEEDKIKTNLSIFGLGTTYYFLDNFFATASFGMSEFHFDSDISTFNATANRIVDNIVCGLAIQAAVGKEWWVSDNWGLGASVALLYGFDFGEYEYRDASTTVSIRFSATYN